MLLQTDVSPWLQVFGRFHIVLLHLPIGLLPALFLLEFGALVIKKPTPRGPLLALSVFTAGAAALAFASGLVLGGESEHRLLSQHKNYAIAMTALCVLLPILAARQSRRPFRIGVAAAVALSVVTGHLGGSMTHRSDFLFKPLERGAAPPAPSGTQDAGPQDAGPQEPGAPDGTPPAVDDPPASHFQRVIAPIFARTCNACHDAATEKGPKGDLILSTIEGVRQLDVDPEDRVIQPGKPDESALIQLCELPLDDDDHMPPSDEPQPTKEELRALRQWILDGAKLD